MLNLAGIGGTICPIIILATHPHDHTVVHQKWLWRGHTALSTIHVTAECVSISDPCRVYPGIWRNGDTDLVSIIPGVISPEVYAADSIIGANTHGLVVCPSRPDGIAQSMWASSRAIIVRCTDDRCHAARCAISEKLLCMGGCRNKAVPIGAHCRADVAIFFLIDIAFIGAVSLIA